MSLFNKSISGVEAEKIMAARRSARGGDVVAKRFWVVDGLEHYARQFAAYGDAVSADKLKDAVREARAALKAESDALQIADAPIPDHVTLAARDVAKGLMKSMAGAFMDIGEATEWAKGNLPLTAAVREHDAATKRARDAGRLAVKARREYLAAVERHATFATGESTEYKALAVLSAAGRAVQPA